MANPIGWTNGDVTVTISYPAEVVTKQYSLDGTTWNTYISEIAIDTNNTTIYAKGLDAGMNQTTQASLTITNIDKIVPTITATDGGASTSSITVNAVASDLGSGINTSSYEYSKDNGVTWTVPTSAASYIFDSLIAGTYDCKVRVTDNAGNVGVSSTVSIATLIDEYLKFTAADTFGAETTKTYFSGYSWSNPSFFGSYFYASTLYDPLTGYEATGSSIYLNSPGMTGWSVNNTSTTRSRTYYVHVTNGSGMYGYNSTTYTRSKTKTQGNYLGIITGGSYPTNGIHTDGYWYVKITKGNNTHMKFAAADAFGTETTTTYFSGYSWSNPSFFGSSFYASTLYDPLTGYEATGASIYLNSPGKTGWSVNNTSTTRSRTYYVHVTNGSGMYGYNSTTYTRTKVKAQGSYMGVVSGSYPTNGLHTDGYWYIAF
jgi:hypothetical protein